MSIKSLMMGAVVAASSIVATAATATTAEWGTISAIYGTANGAVLFDSSGKRSGKPACQGPGLDARWALDGSTVAGQAQIAILLNAYNLKKRIFIAGTNHCSIWSDTETVTFFVMQD